MEMIHCRVCGTRFDPELLVCPVCKAEVVPPKPEEKKARRREKKQMPVLALPSLPDPTMKMRIVERPAMEGTWSGAIWSDVLGGLLGGILLPVLVGISVFAAMSSSQFPYLWGFLLLALPVGIDAALFFNVLNRYRYFAIGLGISTLLSVFALGLTGLMFAGSALFQSFRG